MEPTVVLVTLILQIASSRCRDIDFLTNKFEVDRDFVSPNIAERFALPGPPHKDLYQNLDRFNELKKFFKVIPFKGNEDLKNNTIPDEHESDKDFPIAVIMASNLEETLSDSLKPTDINDYFTKVIENSYKFDKNNDGKKKKGKKQAELALDKDKERLLQYETKLDITTNNPTIDSNDKIIDLEPIEAINEMELKKIINMVKKKPNTNSNTQTPTHKNDTSVPQSPTHSEDISLEQHTHNEVSNSEANINLNTIKTDEVNTLQDDILNMHDLITSIHDLDKLQIGKYVTDNNHSVNKTFDAKSTKRQRFICCKEFNATDDLIHRNYNFKLVFNL